MPSRSSVLGALTAVLLLGCSEAAGPEPQDRAGAAPAPALASANASLDATLAALRRRLAPFHRFEAAVAAGWSAQITSCFSDPTLGGQGFHYGNPALIDGSAAALEPELLLYEPQVGGGLRLVGVEYIVPFTAWAGAEPPSLFGRAFHRNEAFGVWALHLWIWRHNPSGRFADWNPRVHCP
jgi:hypothetical protein